MDRNKFDKNENPAIYKVSEKKVEKSKLEIPEILKETRVLYIVKQVFCPKKHNLIDKNYLISGYPAIRLRYYKKDKSKTEIALSAVLGDIHRRIIEGDLSFGESVDIRCPFCDTKLPVLSHSFDKNNHNVNTIKKSDLAILYLTPELDHSKIIGFCNQVGTIKSIIKYEKNIFEIFK